MLKMKSVESYFGDVNPRFLSKFNDTTPQGNQIEGYLCRKPNQYMGSLLITHVNGKRAKQFVQSMPKIRYFERDEDIWIKDNYGLNYHTCHAYEKLDGSCIIVYPLKVDGEIIELVPKTRGKAVADPYFTELFNLCDHKALENFYHLHKKKGSLFFELYGTLNQHQILHYDSHINMALIGGYIGGKFLTGTGLKKYHENYGFNIPDCLFEIIYNGVTYNIYPTSEKYKAYQMTGHKWYVASSKQEIPNVIQSLLEQLNSEFKTQNNRIALEGVVINTKNEKGYQKYLKVKPREIEKAHRSINGIPKSEVIKECLKYFDEYGEQKVGEIYYHNPDHHTHYIHQMLSEEYDPVTIKKSTKKIEAVFMQVWDNKKVPESLHNIADTIFEKYSGQGITQCMRMFAQEYPMKKKHAKMMYSVFENRFARAGISL